jgi:hypothetical protein
MAYTHHRPRLLYATKTTQWSDLYFSGADPSLVMMVEGLQPERVDESEVDVHYACDDRLLARKVASLRAQASQVEPFLQTLGLENYTALVREEFFREPRQSDPEYIERARTFGG